MPLSPVNPRRKARVARRHAVNAGLLKRQKGESLTELLSRLNLAIAIARAHTEDIFTDEINPANAKRP
jgi:hypothetical protein